MYVTDTMNSLNFYPHQVRFETVRDVDNARRHNWSPGYYAGTADDASLGHRLDDVVTVTVTADTVISGIATPETAPTT